MSYMFGSYSDWGMHVGPDMVVMKPLFDIQEAGSFGQVSQLRLGNQCAELSIAEKSQSAAVFSGRHP